MENTHGIAHFRPYPDFNTDVYKTASGYVRNYKFHVYVHTPFHTKFHIPYCFSSYIKLENMDGSIGGN